jgi:hypothetical protein
MFPRNSQWWNVAVFLTILIALSLLNLLKPGDNALQIAELEKRQIQPWPAFSWSKLWDGELFQAYDDYFADHFVFRNGFIELGLAAGEFKGWHENGGVSIVKTSGGNNMAGALADTDDPEATGQGHSAGEVLSNESSSYLVVGNRAMQLYAYSPESAEAYAAVVNQLRQSIDERVRFYAMLVPSAVEFEESEQLRRLSDSQRQAFEHVYSLLDAGIHRVPAYANIERHRNEYVYFRTDHHWTSLGAYYGYEALAQAMDLTPVPLDAYEAVELPGFLGTTYAATRKPELKKNPDTLTVYLPSVEHEYKIFRKGSRNGVKRSLVEQKLPVDGRGGYAVFLGGDFALGHITTGADGDRRAMVIKDSFANALIPFLLPHFQEIFVIDPRYYKGHLPTDIENYGVTDVVLLNGPIVTSYTGISHLLQEQIRSGT